MADSRSLDVAKNPRCCTQTLKAARSNLSRGIREVKRNRSENQQPFRWWQRHIRLSKGIWAIRICAMYDNVGTTCVLCYVMKLMCSTTTSYLIIFSRVWFLHNMLCLNQQDRFSCSLRILVHLFIASSCFTLNLLVLPISPSTSSASSCFASHIYHTVYITLYWQQHLLPCALCISHITVMCVCCVLLCIQQGFDSYLDHAQILKRAVPQGTEPVACCLIKQCKSWIPNSLEPGSECSWLTH